MSVDNPRMKREKKTIEVMIKMSCRGHHGKTKELCPDCNELFNYAMVRLDKCRFRNDKPTCAKCTVICFKPDMREKVRAVMRYAGPRMLVRHPVLAIPHLRDSRKNSPDKSTQNKKSR